MRMFFRCIVRAVAREVIEGIREAQAAAQPSQSGRPPAGSQIAAAERACAEMRALQIQDALRRALRNSSQPEPPARA